MGLKSMLTSKWFVRLALVCWIVCGAFIIFVFKNMESIVHGQLYSFGLIFSPEWADSYRLFTYLIFVSVGVPAALSGVALFSSFLVVKGATQRNYVVPKKMETLSGVGKVGLQKNCQSPQVRQFSRASHVQAPATKVVSQVNNGNCVGISCPECKKVFGRALVMLDFRSGTNRMVSVCPYCNHVLGFQADEKAENDEFVVGFREKTIEL